MARTIKKYLKNRGMTASDLARELGISRQVLSHRIKQGYLVGKVDGIYKIYHPRDMLEVEKPRKKN